MGQSGERHREIVIVKSSVPWVLRFKIKSTCRIVIFPLGFTTQIKSLPAFARCFPRNLKSSSGTIAYSISVAFCFCTISRIFSRVIVENSPIFFDGFWRWARSSAKARARPCSAASRAASGLLASIRTFWSRL